MFVMVTGASGSGKSEYAEQQITAFAGDRRYYIATMECRDRESERRIARHRAMRAGKGFETLECPLDLEQLCARSELEGADVLLECMSNLAANEMFDGGSLHEAKAVSERLLHAVKKLQTVCRHLVVVTNEVFSGGTMYDPWTQEYLRCLGSVNTAMAARADRVVEVVCSIPIILREKCEEEITI